MKVSSIFGAAPIKFDSFDDETTVIVGVITAVVPKTSKYGPRLELTLDDGIWVYEAPPTSVHILSKLLGDDFSTWVGKAIETFPKTITKENDEQIKFVSVRAPASTTPVKALSPERLIELQTAQAAVDAEVKAKVKSAAGSDIPDDIPF